MSLVGLDDIEQATEEEIYGSRCEGGGCHALCASGAGAKTGEADWPAVKENWLSSSGAGVSRLWASPRDGTLRSLKPTACSKPARIAHAVRHAFKSVGEQIYTDSAGNHFGAPRADLGRGRDG